jgi:hypothetical protein
MKWIQSLLGFFYDIVFGCRHWSQTRPFTLDQQTYKVCLDCGKQIYYSPERMTPLSAREVRRMKAATAGPVTVIGTPAISLAGVQINRTRLLKVFKRSQPAKFKLRIAWRTACSPIRSFSLLTPTNGTSISSRLILCLLQRCAHDGKGWDQ